MKSVYLHKRLTTLLLKSFTFLLIFLMNFTVSAQDAVDVARQKEGRKLYNNLCASCHKLDRKLIGPALGGVQKEERMSG